MLPSTPRRARRAFPDGALCALRACLVEHGWDWPEYVLQSVITFLHCNEITRPRDLVGLGDVDVWPGASQFDEARDFVLLESVKQ